MQTLKLNDLKKPTDGETVEKEEVSTVLENRTSSNISIDEADFEDKEDEVKTEEVSDNVIDIPKDKVVEDVEKDKSEPPVEEEDDDDKDEEITEDSSDDEEDEDAKYKENLKEVQTQLKKIVKPVKDVVDLSEFSISKNAINLNNAIPMENKNVSNWVMYSVKRSIAMEEFKGYDLNVILDTEAGSKSPYNKYKDIFTRIYNHIKSVKPVTMLEWAKVTRFSVLDDIYFSMLKSSFEGVNYIAYQCTKCGKPWVSEDIPMENMYKCKDDKVKKTIDEIITNSSEEDQYDVYMEQVSNNHAIGYKHPSIYDVIFEPSLLEEKFREKYAELLEMLVYIDNIYYIDRETKKLREIELELFENNPAKTLKSKIRKYAQVLNELTSDQFGKLAADIADLQKENSDDISYIMPGYECPHCHHKNTDAPMTAQRLLFIRHQLVSLANM